MSPNRFLLAAAAVAAVACAPFAAQAQEAAPSAAASTKPVTVQGDLIDTLKLNGGFTTFVSGLDSTNLSSLVKGQKTLTVFAPSDAAFAAMPAEELAKLKADKAAMQKFLLHHVINAPVESAKIKGTRGEWPTVAGDKVLLDGSEETALKADGATIAQADLRTANGVLHIVDKPLVAGQGAPAPAASAGN